MGTHAQGEEEEMKEEEASEEEVESMETDVRAERLEGGTRGMKSAEEAEAEEVVEISGGRF